MKKRYICVLLLLVLLLQGCGTEKPHPPEETKPEIVTTEKPVFTLPPKQSLTVIIDPGHGFDDVGSEPQYLHAPECVLTLQAAKKLEAALAERGIFSILTHDGVSFPSVETLTAQAKKYGVDFEAEKFEDNNVFSAYERRVYENILATQLGDCIFVSLHTNSIEDHPDVYGLTVDYWKENPTAPQLDRFCRSLQAALWGEMGAPLSVYADSTEEAFIVTKSTAIPSFLIEMGYGSNAADAENLQSEAWMTRFVSVLADVIAEEFD